MKTQRPDESMRRMAGESVEFPVEVHPAHAQFIR
jgi:hypothetical protein